MLESMLFYFILFCFEYFEFISFCNETLDTCWSLVSFYLVRKVETRRGEEEKTRTTTNSSFLEHKEETKRRE